MAILMSSGIWHSVAVRRRMVRSESDQPKEKIMSSAFADITFTPSVKAAQTLYGSRDANRGFELADDARNELTERETRFIAARDSFYQATVSESGWPYGQHRGGAAGFLKVLDARTIG